MTHCCLLHADLSDLFVSVQGEGPLVGVRQVFVRFAGCNLACSYCDTDFSPRLHLDWKGIYDFVAENLPVHSVALTGGEPLLQVRFLLQLLPAIKDLGVRVYLETNGTLPNQLSEIAPFLDWVAMDVKLPSVAGVQDLWQHHEEFLRQVPDRANLIVKVVVSEEVSEEDRDRFEALLLQVERDMIITLQPVWGREKETVPLLLDWQRRLLRIFPYEVRIIPQVHRCLGVK